MNIAGSRSRFCSRRQPFKLKPAKWYWNSHQSLNGKRILDSSGWRMLDDVTVSSLEACRFSPVTRNGQRASLQWKRYKFSWTLKDHVGKAPSNPTLLRETCAGSEWLALTDHPRGKDGILLRFLTSPQGKAFGIKIEKGSGDEAVDDEAVQLLRRCDFVPSLVAGKPVLGNAFARYQYGPKP